MPRVLGAATGPLWGWGARSTPVPLETSALQGLFPSQGMSVSPCAPKFHVPLICGAHQLHVAEAVLGRKGLINNDPSGQAQPRGQQRVSHHEQPKDSFITFSPFHPTPPSPTSTCGAERNCWRTWGWTLVNGQGEGRGRTYSLSWGSRRPLKEEQGKQIKGSWPSPREGTAGLGVGGHTWPCHHSLGPHGHPCSLVLQDCPAGKTDGVRGGGNGAPVWCGSSGMGGTPGVRVGVGQ